MRRVALAFVDVALVVVATLMALLLRENLVVSAPRLLETAPYIWSSALAALLVFPLFGLNRAVWRFSSLPDYIRIASAILIVVASALALTFALNRLDGVARSLPIIQAVLAIGLMVGVRVAYRMFKAQRSARRAASRPLRLADDDAGQSTVIVVGVSPLTEAFLQSVDEFAQGRVRIAGLLGRSDRHVGRLVASHKVLGVPEDVEDVLDTLEVHGIVVDRIVVATPTEMLSVPAREALLRVEGGRPVALQFLAEDLGLTPPGSTVRDVEEHAPSDDDKLLFSFPPDLLDELARQPYWRVKRFIDVVVSAGLLVVLMPVILLVGLLVAFVIGQPVAFWQHRPGLGGRSFRLYKFRTMAPAHGPDGRRLSDEERTSRLGNFLRRTRLDELPQLFNILRGDMSFVGPRPLLPRDQPPAYRARLLVRPGLTGWAQVVGGRVISAEDKAALDVWYVRNASLVLDLEILLRTVPMVLLGEQVRAPLIVLAWNDLVSSGIVTSTSGWSKSQQLKQAA